MALERTEPTALWERKLALLREILGVTQQELLLVDLDGLSALLARKEALIQEIKRIDEGLEPVSARPGVQDEMAAVVEAVLENERTLERRLAEEQGLLRSELRDFDRQTRLKRYLERSRTRSGTVNLRK
jgi:hypothetical protein